MSLIMEIQHYTPDFVRSLESSYTHGIQDSIKQVLLHLKKKNSFTVYPTPTESKQSVFGTKRTGPPPPKVQGDSEWREMPVVQRPTIGGKGNPTKKECALLLNKLSESNFEVVSSQIVQLVTESNQKGDPIIEFLIERLFQSAMIQVNFCPLYARICKLMMENPAEDGNLRCVLMEKITGQLGGLRENRDSVSSDDYEEFCSSMAWKNRHIGCYQFITELYNHKTVPIDKIVEIVNEIIEMIRKETVIFKMELLIDCICRIYKSIEQNKSIVRTKIEDILGKMRDQLNFRSIFILEDVLKGR